MEFRILGALEIDRGDTTVSPASQRERAMLSLLLLRANSVVASGELIRGTWDEPPATARQQVYCVVSRLRSLLAPNGTDVLALAPPGYLLRLGQDQLDLAVFQRLVAQATAARGAGDPVRASNLLGRALVLWRGVALPDLDTLQMRAEAARLSELHLHAWEERIAVDLLLGREEALVPELTGLVAAHPHRERLRGQLMVALYRTGRQSEALAVYREGRRRLVDDMGVEPGPELRALEAAILSRDPSLDRQTPAALAPSGPRTDETGQGSGRVRNDLPRAVPDLIGREEAMRRLLAATAPGNSSVVVAVDGMGGVGKTALVVHAAHLLAGRYPDGQLFIDLRGHTAGRQPVDPMRALGTLLRASGVPGERLPTSLDERAALWRATLADRRQLMVLDNAANAAQVRPLLPGATGCLTIVTSRRRLTGLDCTLALSLDVLSPAHSIELFEKAVGERTARAEREAVASVVRLCGHLPLAIRIAAARLRHRAAWTADHVAARLGDEQRRLGELAAEDCSVSGAFGLSYDHLTATQRQLFRWLGLIPGEDFDPHASATVAGLPPGVTGRVLEDLVDAHLLEQRAPGRYHFHDLIRQFARQTAEAEEPEPDRARAIDRLVDYYLTTAAAAVEHIDPRARRITLELPPPPDHAPHFDGWKASMSWLEAERVNLTQTVAYAYRQGRLGHCWQLARVLWPFYHLRAHTDDWQTTHHTALKASRELGRPDAIAATLDHLGVAYWTIGRDTQAAAHLHEALGLYQTIGDRLGQGGVLGMLGRISQRSGRYEQALRHFDRSVELIRQVGDRLAEAHTLNSAAIVHYRCGQPDKATDNFHRALDAFRASGDAWNEARILTNVGYLELRSGRPERALVSLERSLALRHELGDRRSSQVVNNLGIAYRELGRFDEALRNHREALTVVRDANDRPGECETLNDLAETLHAAGRRDDALARHREALHVAEEVGDLYQQARAHDGAAEVLSALEPDAAADHWGRALALYSRLGVPDADRVRDRL